MQAQLRRGDPGHNEVVVDTRSVEQHLPWSILGFFFLGQNPGRAGEEHGRFLTRFGLNASQVPLVRINLEASSRSETFVAAS